MGWIWKLLILLMVGYIMGSLIGHNANWNSQVKFNQVVEEAFRAQRNLNERQVEFNEVVTKALTRR